MKTVVYDSQDAASTSRHHSLSFLINATDISRHIGWCCHRGTNCDASQRVTVCLDFAAVPKRPWAIRLCNWSYNVCEETRWTGFNDT